MTATSSGELNVLTRPDLDLRQLTERVDAALERALLEQRIVGALVLVARDGQILYRRAVGLSDREASTPMREDTLFRLASLTKPVVSVAALGLASEGAFELDAPLTRWLPDFRPRAPDGSSSAISVRHLLTHTSGLGYGLFDAEGDAYARAGVSNGLDQPALSFAENARRIASAPLLSRPGEGRRLRQRLLGRPERAAERGAADQHRHRGHVRTAARRSEVRGLSTLKRFGRAVS